MIAQCVGILLLLEVVPQGATRPFGTIDAVATQTRYFGSQVILSYMEPVNCTLRFDQDVVNFSSSAFDTTLETKILSFVEVSASTYTFQLAADTNANVTAYLPPSSVSNAHGEFNNVTMAAFSFTYYAFPPAVTLRLDGYTSRSTSELQNKAYLMFNSTTVYHGTSHFDASSVSLSPDLAIASFMQVSDVMYTFQFEVLQNDSAASSQTECVKPSLAPGPGFTKFKCSRCPRVQDCMSMTTLPPSGIDYLEFPFEVVLAPLPALGMEAMSLPFTYDTLWPEVTLDAPAYAKGPFFITIVWSEALADVTAVQPVFGALGPSVSQEALEQNLTILNSSAYKVLVVPASTGILTMNINGTSDSADLAGNRNDFRLRSFTKTGSQRTVIYSDGPPIEGELSFQYSRPPSVYEYRATVDMLGVPSLTIYWDGFTTATSYDLWVEWGDNQSWMLASNIVDTSFRIAEFHAMLGLEYVFTLRAYNYWGDAIAIHKTFLHPSISVIADGSYKMIHLPDFLSAQKTNVTFYAILKENSFLSFNSLRALSFRTINRESGDVEPCDQNSQLLRCTLLNFHVEVPQTQFIVFRQPIRLQFIWGRAGWQDIYFKPQLRYWEDYHEEWRIAADSCPPHQKFERWNDLHKVYTVAICHLSQFAVFELFSPPPPTTTAPPPPRPESDTNPMFFVVAGIIILVLLCICSMGYLLYKNCWKKQNVRTFHDLGILSVRDRLPNRARPNTADMQQKAWGQGVEDAHELVPALGDRQPESDSYALDDAAPVVPGGIQDSQRR